MDVSDSEEDLLAKLIWFIVFLVHFNNLYAYTCYTLNRQKQNIDHKKIKPMTPESVN